MSNDELFLDLLVFHRLIHYELVLLSISFGLLPYSCYAIYLSGSVWRIV